MKEAIIAGQDSRARENRTKNIKERKFCALSAQKSNPLLNWVGGVGWESTPGRRGHFQEKHEGGGKKRQNDVMSAKGTREEHAFL